MKIVVCIKQVPDTTEIRLDPVTGTLIRDGVPSIMNPDDKAGLEMALELKDQYGAHVTVITMGPPQADDILREAFAMGADRAIHLSDRKFAGADTLATSNAIAGALRMLEFDLVITGRQAIDGDTAQVGPQIAEHLGLPQVTYLEGIKYEGGNRLVVKKWTEEGYQLLEVFFQAEDGIRDVAVTGVQTCALPIYVGGSRNCFAARKEELLLEGSNTLV